ncbi:serine/threonine-protein kinase [Nocardia puris]|uniref:serine/threonine-protein kinase n=1 Tax=Nocardia puris TaxID=208602 RepID=UPI002B4B2628|nr:protein kinase [Nocardia puris]
MIAEHYRLVERIGSGGTGVVWRATDERLRRSVAIKQIAIQPSLPESERDIVRQRAIREARNAARFQHPNAIVVFDITEHEGDPCLVMEYLKSRSLAAVLSAQGTLPLTQVARIGEQVASALIAAHQAGIVHRDVKPGNVLLDDHGTVKITDFGISRATGDVTLTETGLICGTAAYLAPEVARGADPTPAADVFSLGATLFHALEGEPPYGSSANPLAVLYAAANGQVSEPRNAGPATDFLLALLNPDPEDRPSMRVARDTLAAFADSGATPVPAGFVPASEAFARRQGAQEAATRALHRAAPAQSTERISRPLPPPARGAAHPDTAAHPRTAAQPRPASSGASGKRRAVLIGGAVGAVVAVTALLLTSTNDSDSGAPSAQADTPSISTSAGGTTSAQPSQVGQTTNAGPVDIGSAGMLIERFYSNPGSSWDLLTPAVQSSFGSKQAYEQYWAQDTIQSFGRIYAPNGINSDKSVDLIVSGLTYGGSTKNPLLRVIDAGGGRLLIDSDPR